MPPPPVQRSEAEIRQLLDNTRNLLDQGQEDAALSELQKILSSDRTNKVALGLMRQIRDDPMDLYGRESFPYRVQQGDTLATIAQRFLADRDQFYGLARYNSIKVPRQLPYGQTIRIPGKQRAPTGPTAPAAPPLPTPAPPADPPQVASSPPTPPAPPDPAMVEREKQAAIDRAIRQARAAMARQDICGAIAGWDEVLRIDPNHRTAALERDKALELKKRLPSSKC